MFSNRSIKWYFRIIVFLLETACINSWVIYKLHQILINQSKFYDYTDFRRRLGKNLARGLKRALPTTPTKIPITHRDTDEKLVILWSQCHLEKSSKRRICAYCKGRQTQYICGKCELNYCDVPCYDLHKL